MNENELKTSLEKAVKRGIITQEQAEAILPELKSEDKEMIEIIRGAIFTATMDETTRCDALAWLEKQGEQRHLPFKAEHGKYYYCIKDYFCGGKKRASKGDVVQALRGLPIMGLDDASEFFLPVNDMQLNKLNNAINHNDRPKFKVGDWVVIKDGKVNQVKAVSDDGDAYTLDDGTYFSGSWKDMYHLWTIQDAKDGDVLANEYGSVFIYAGFEDDERITVDNYCYITANHDEFCIEDHKTGSWYYVKELIPATKEQRDLLFQKMKEAGYKWDAEKKELKKVEQNPADKVEPKFEIGDLITNGILVGKIDEYHGLGYHANFGDHYADVPDIENWHKWTIQDAKDGDVLSYRDGQWIFIYKEKIADGSFYYHTLYSTIHQDLIIDDAGFTLLDEAIIPATKEQCDFLFQKMKEAGYEWDNEKKELRKIEQNPAWSEEDEEMLRRCISATFDHGYLKECDWLKNRVQLKSKSEWSEDDEKKFIQAYAFIENTNLKDVDDIKASLFAWLKSLKERYTWKPSNEQLHYLSWIANIKLGDSIVEQEVSKHLNELYNDLKKLKG